MWFVEWFEEKTVVGKSPIPTWMGGMILTKTWGLWMGRKKISKWLKWQMLQNACLPHSGKKVKHTHTKIQIDRHTHTTV
jgi:hypothetical protein